MFYLIIEEVGGSLWALDVLWETVKCHLSNIIQEQYRCAGMCKKKPSSFKMLVTFRRKSVVL